MSEWKTYRLGDICTLVAGFAFKSNNFGDYPDKVIKIADIQPPIVDMSSLTGVDISQYNSQKLEKYKIQKGDYVLAMTGATIGKLGRILSEKNAYINQRVLLFKPIDKYIDKNYLYYYLCQNIFYSHIRNHIDSETAQPNISANSIGEFTLTLPPLDEQRRIAGILGSLDDKIELNRRINANLEAQAQALFRSWFVDNDNQLGNYQTKSLTDIAQYLNGLAMQKFPPESIQNSLPVLKIKELGQGLCDASSDRCSTSIKPEYVINDGDVIFSWSGTLLVDVWCGGKCGLNQHLFKVTSDNYPKWFIFYWTKHHLDKFIRIAKDKAVTMGHIKRCDLESSEVKVPEKPILEYLDKIFTPFFDSMIAHRIENRKLSALRDTLLPKLMAGEIKI